MIIKRGLVGVDAVQEEALRVLAVLRFGGGLNGWPPGSTGAWPSPGRHPFRTAREHASRNSRRERERETRYPLVQVPV